MNRRKLLSLMVHAGGAAIAAVIAVPVAVNSLSPLLTKEPEHDWRSLGPFIQFPTGKIVSARIQIHADSGKLNDKGVFVWRRALEDFIVYSRSCTDLGCPLNFDPGSEWFFCPCHGGVFDKDGKRRAGPPKLPMWRYSTRIRESLLEIDLRSLPAMV